MRSSVAGSRGERLQTTVTSVSSGSLSMLIMDGAAFGRWEQWVKGNPSAPVQSCASQDGVRNGNQIYCDVHIEGDFFVVYYNASATPITLSNQRPMSRWEITYHQAEALFQELRARGLRYVDLEFAHGYPSNDLTPQTILYPSESLLM